MTENDSSLPEIEEEYEIEICHMCDDDWSDTEYETLPDQCRASITESVYAAAPLELKREIWRNPDKFTEDDGKIVDTESPSFLDKISMETTGTHYVEGETAPRPKNWCGSKR